MPDGLPADGYIAMRAFTSDVQRDLLRQRQERAWGHNLPDSVLIAAMGNHWSPGAWQRVTDMVMFTNKAGIYCGLQELQDRCLNWGDALGTMRNEGLLFAKNEGFEWVCWVDNDILPEPDMLVKLLGRRVSVIAPFVAEPGTGRPLHGPVQGVRTGLQPVKWTVLSLLLIRTAVFNCTGPRFWSDALGADEGFHFQVLWHFGHQLYLDTDQPLMVARPPTYPLASNQLPWADREKLWQERRQKMLIPPDRRPINPADANEHGHYMPFGMRIPVAGSVAGSVMEPMVRLPGSAWEGTEW